MHHLWHVSPKLCAGGVSVQVDGRCRLQYTGISRNMQALHTGYNDVNSIPLHVARYSCVLLILLYSKQCFADTNAGKSISFFHGNANLLVAVTWRCYPVQLAVQLLCVRLHVMCSSAHGVRSTHCVYRVSYSEDCGQTAAHVALSASVLVVVCALEQAASTGMPAFSQAYHVRVSRCQHAVQLHSTGISILVVASW